jgi:hypothetical protein
MRRAGKQFFISVIRPDKKRAEFPGFFQHSARSAIGKD